MPAVEFMFNAVFLLFLGVLAISFAIIAHSLWSTPEVTPADCWELCAGPPSGWNYDWCECH